MGILRRAFERGKALPKKLERALKIQAGLALPDGQITDIDAYHINQRDEGIDLQGVSGALMATSNMQMQTFVTQASENTEGFDGYNGDLTGDVAATLGVNCGMSTGRNGVIAFAANQRDEVRDLHDVAGALNAQPGIKQQTFVAGFSAGAGASAGSIGYHESVAPTLKASASGNSMPSVLCINDQGGQVMEISEGMTGTLRAQEHGHQPLVYENHGIDSRYRQMEEVSPTMSARYGTGGNNVPLVEQEPVICITGNAIYPHRKYFFQSPSVRGDGMYSMEWIIPTFRRFLQTAGISGYGEIRPRLYDLRHTFATHRLYQWVKEGKDINACLAYLSEYMGHSNLESTAYYIHLLPTLYTDLPELRLDSSLEMEADLCD